LIKNVLRFWLDTKKVDGFRIDAVRHFVESDTWLDEPHVRKSDIDLYSDRIGYDDLEHLYTSNQKETYELIYAWREICNEIGKKTNKERVLLLEATYAVEDLGTYYFLNGKPNGHCSLNFQFCFINNYFRFIKDETKRAVTEKLDRSFNPYYIKYLIDQYLKYLPDNCWMNWQLGNHDNPRIANRVDRENIDCANALYLLLGGTPVTYYGEEIGMEELPLDRISFEKCQDERAIARGVFNFNIPNLKVHKAEF
jgi:alpha-glucosidase